jgi:endonuclease/exonuclease/phosphatase (EEP) superfamily protein YafD
MIAPMSRRDAVIDFLLRRVRIAALLCLGGLMIPPVSALLPQDSGGIALWLLDLACHWQWLFAAGLVASVLASALALRRWLILLPCAALPLFDASPMLPEAPAGAETFVVASANVLWTNTDLQPLLRWIAAEQPDVVVLLEVAPAHAAALAGLAGYPHRHVVASEDPFGIALLSRHPLQRPLTVRDSQGLPHIEAQAAWQGRRVNLLAVHPMPPLSAHFHAERNAKLARWASSATASGLPAIIAGDLNATPWSTAFNDLDALGMRRATGLAPTWPTLLQGASGIPIDHVLANHHWARIASARGPDLGSDHLPVIARLRPVAPR